MRNKKITAVIFKPMKKALMKFGLSKIAESMEIPILINGKELFLILKSNYQLTWRVSTKAMIFMQNK